jgi:murein DD-endopeptidase MepM/ murein hydrolase activator NlpD
VGGLNRRSALVRPGEWTKQKPAGWHISGVPTISTPRIARSLLAFAVLVTTACGAEETIRDVLTPEPTPHEAYSKALREAGLEATALGHDWFVSAEEAVQRPVGITLPFRETGYFDPDEAPAVGFRLSLRRGQKLTMRVELADSNATRLFVDLFRDPPDTADALDRVASAGDGGRSLEFEARRDGDYLLRVQPELLRGGRYTLTLQSGASLAFPVSGRDSRAIRSGFGAERDGGRRDHHGVDIFAPRGTPVVSSAAGVVRRVEVTSLGGKVVWVTDPVRGGSIYYAHLDSQMVRRGMTVSVGDTIGLVGNTGNARTTPPHLHFGIYQRGPIDPYPFVHQPRTAPPAVVADLNTLGEWARTSAPTGTLRGEQGGTSSAIAQLPRHTVLRVQGASGSWYRARLPDGSTGWISARETEPLARALRTEQLPSTLAVREQPAAAAALMELVPGGARVSVLGQFAGYLYVRTPEGRAGWLTSAPAD